MKKIAIRIIKLHNVSKRLELLCKKAVFCNENERNKILITASELIDNLITHGEIGVLGVIVTLRIEKHRITCGIYVETHNAFAEFSKSRCKTIFFLSSITETSRVVGFVRLNIFFKGD